MPYAEHTEVPAERSKEMIRRRVMKAGAVRFITAEDTEARRAAVQFELSGRLIRFTVNLPGADDDDVRLTARGRGRAAEAAERARARKERQRWRALLLVITAKLESIETGVETFEEAFLPQTVLPDGRTAAERMLPVIDEAYQTGRLPAARLAQAAGLLPPAGTRHESRRTPAERRTRR